MPTYGGDAGGDEANGHADLVAEALRARGEPGRGDRGPAGSGKAVEGRPAGGWTHHGGSPHVAIPLSRGRRPGQAWRRSTRRTCLPRCDAPPHRSEEHTSELQSLMRISYAVFCLKKKR